MSHAATTTSAMRTRRRPTGGDYHSQDDSPGRGMKPLAPLLATAYGRLREARDWPPRKILLIRRNRIGGMICALPHVRRVRPASPAARISVLSRERKPP